jgi:ferric-dicitrate binding protein FerR (iron transport regulator)
VVNKNENPSLPKFSDIKSHLSWRQREIYFQCTPLSDVLDQLERWYDVEFQLPDKQSAENLVTIRIENKPIKDITEVIALMNDFHYIQKNRKIIFSFKK